MSQATVSRCVKAVCTKLVSRTQICIKFPDIAEQERVKRGFFAIAPLPGVMGCIDCTHICIPCPGGINAELYRNRHNKYSLNGQGVCDANLKFLNIISSWPGSTHDSRIFKMSNLHALLKIDHQEGTYRHLLGDSGYPCLKYLLTPILNPTTDKEKRYNSAHIKIRNTVERSFGVLKRRFACLSEKARTELETTKKLIMSCAILHNIAIDQRIPLLDKLQPPQHNGRWYSFSLTSEGEGLRHVDYHTAWRLHHNGLAAANLIRVIPAVFMLITVEGLGDALSS